MMAPYEIKAMTIKQLRDTRSAMSTYVYLMEVEKLPEEKRKEAAILSDEVQMAYLKLRNAELGQIRDKLIENEKDLVNGADSVNTALADLKKVEKILGIVEKFLGIVVRVIPLV